MARTITKLDMRNDLIQWMKENKEVDLNRFIEYVQLPKVQHGLKLYIEQLKRKQ